MDNTSTVKRSQRKTLGARVSEDLYEEFDVIRRQRGDDSLSETVRWALGVARRKHWQDRVNREGS